MNFYNKIRYFILTICWVLVITTSLHAQEKTNATQIFSKLKEFRSVDSIFLYYKHLDSLSDYYTEMEFIDSLQNLKSYYDYLPGNKEDSIAVRRYTYLYAQNLKNQNNYPLALKYYLKASDYSPDLQTDKRVWFCENYIGQIYARLNEYNKAIQYYKKCIPFLTSDGDFGKLSRLYKEIGRAYMWLESFQDMENYYRQGLKFGQQSGEYKGLQAIHSAYLEYYLDNDTTASRFQRARLHLDSSRYYLKKLYGEKDYFDRLYELDQLEGQYFHGINKFTNALCKYQDAIENAKAIYVAPTSREIAKIYQKLALTYLVTGELELANRNIKLGFAKLLRQYKGGELPEKNQMDRENTFVDLLSLKANYYEKKYDEIRATVYLDSALMSLDLAMDANDQLSRLLVLQQSKDISSGTHKELINHAVEICYRLYSLNKTKNYLDKLRLYFDKSKGALLREKLANLALRNGMKRTDSEKLDDLESQLVQLYQQEFEEGRNIQMEEEIIRVNENINSIQAKYNRTQNKTHPIQGAWIEYVVTEKETYLMTNIGNKPIFTLGKSDDIIAAIQRLNNFIEKRDYKLFETESEKLFHVLIPVDISKTKYITIIPDGLISFVPFDILMHRGKFLMENHVLSLSFHHKQPVVKKKNNWLLRTLIVKPNYPVPEVPGYVSTDRGSLFVLPFAKEEVEDIRQKFEGWINVREDMDADQLTKLVKSHDIFHFAGHAIAKGDSSYLVLTKENGEIFSIPDVLLYNMSNNLDLVTLSACETGLGTFKQGESVRSLAGSFLHSGAGAVVYSLWRADDQSTATIMASFYSYLKEGNRKDEALNLAKKDFLKTCSPDQRHPYFWAGFVIAGNTGPVTAVFSKNQLYGAGIFIALLITLLFYNYKNKTK